MKTLPWQATALLLAATLTGCGPNSGPGERPAPEASASGGRGASPPPATVTKSGNLTTKGAPSFTTVGEEVMRFEQNSEEHLRTVIAIADSGEVLTAHSRVGDGEEITQGRLAISSSGGRPEEVPAGPARPKPQQVTAAAASDRWIVWQETASTDLTVDPWVLYAHDRRTGRTTEVARAAGNEETPPLAPPGWTGPSVVGDHLVWAQAVGLEEEPKADIMSCALPACTDPAVFIESAAFPAVTPEGVYALRRSAYDGVAGDGMAAEIVFRSFDGSATRVVHTPAVNKKEEVSGLVATGEAVTWTVRGPKRSRLELLRGQEILVVEGEPGSLFAFPRATEGLVAWAETGGATPQPLGGYVLDTTSSAVYTLGNQWGLYGIQAGGGAVALQEQGDDGVEAVVVRLPST